MQNSISIVFLVLITTVVASCRNESGNNEVSGIYVNQYTIEKKNINTGEMIGKTIIIDSIIITPNGESYELLNKRWGMNDFDDEGWQNKYDQSRKVHNVIFDKQSNSLSSEFYPKIFLDLKNKILYLNEKKANPYVKIIHN